MKIGNQMQSHEIESSELIYAEAFGQLLFLSKL